MSDEPSLQDFLDAQAYFRLPSLALVQKDWHVLRALSALSGVDARPFRLVFAGGTCLARAHRLVMRMSEDVDFKIVPLDAEPVSGNKLRQQLGALRDRITIALHAAGFPVDPADPSQILSRDGNRYTVYHLQGEQPRKAQTPLRPTIQVELTYATLRLPSVSLPVTSFVAEASRCRMQDAEEFKNQYPRYHADIGGETRKAITALTTSEGVKDRYSDFVAAMVYGEKPDFEIAVATSRALVEKAWPEPASSDTPS